MKKLSKIIILLSFGLTFSSCEKYINVIPDDVPTIDFAFRLRQEAEKALFTCYSYLKWRIPMVSLLGGDEIWVNPNYHPTAKGIALGNQNVVDPIYNFWAGTNGGGDFYEAIRYCNIFLANIDKVPNMEQFEKNKWKAEVKFLKAYYLFFLIRQYGPIILVKKNLPVSSTVNQISRPRDPLDSCFSYVIQLLNGVISSKELPDIIQKPEENYGRIDKAIAYAFKAKVLVYWASPLFNGNKDYVGYTNINGVNPFDTKYDPSRWDSAAVACKKAIDFTENLGFHLYEFESNDPTTSGLNDSTRLKLSIRQSFTLKLGVQNPESIWAEPYIGPGIFQQHCLPFGLNPDNVVNYSALGNYNPPLKIAEMFYTNHGLPIQADTSWDYKDRFELQKVGKDERYFLREGYTTAKLNFNRGVRYYADLAFDGSIWYGSGVYDDSDPNDLLFIQAKAEQVNGLHTLNDDKWSVTGYWPKKLVNFKTHLSSGQGTNSWTNVRYAWPMIRLAGLYLLYAEAENEANGPDDQVFKYLNKVRGRAGLPTVQEAWSNWSNDPNKYKTKEGLRDIIHQERLIELAFEGNRFWDLRRWKEATQVLNEPITGMDVFQSSAKSYYREKFIFQQHFQTRDYFWPLAEKWLQRNPKLTQNPGW